MGRLLTTTGKWTWIERHKVTTTLILHFDEMVKSRGGEIVSEKGSILIEQSNWGMYLVVASFVIFLVAVVLNAWEIMLGIGEAEKK